MRKIYIASDHAGFELKQALIPYIGTFGAEVEDLGPSTFMADDDYPDYILPAAEAVVADEESLGIVLGASGQGEAMAANRIQGVRAVVYYGGNKDIVRLGREHNNANVLSLGARFLSEDEAKEAVALYLSTPFSEDERHIRRLGKF